MDGRRVPDQLIETVRDRNDLVSVVSEYLSLKKAGQNYTGLCPFHAEKSPSFVVSPSKQIFHCFGCGVGGNIFQFVMKMEGIPFPEVLHRLAVKGGVPLPERREGVEDHRQRQESEEIYRVNDAAASYYHRNLVERPEGAVAAGYLKERGMTAETVKAFSIGFALPRRDEMFRQLRRQFPVTLMERAGLISKKEGGVGEEAFFDRFRNRVLFPIRNVQGKIAGFGGRVLDDSTPKYLNTPETPVFIKGKHLFGLDQAKKSGTRTLVIVEGYFDVIAAHQSGMTNVVGTLGTALTPDHLHLIKRISEQVILIFDPDDAGRRAAFRAAPLFLDEGVFAKVVSLPSGEDPDLFIRKEGKEGFLRKLEEGRTLIDFAIFSRTNGFPPKSVEEKVKIIDEVLPLIQKLRNKFEQSHYLKTLSETLQVEERDLRAEFSFRVAGKHAVVPERRPVLEKEQRFPHDEETIVSLLLQNQITPSILVDQLQLEDFSDPRIRLILSSFWDAEERRWSEPRSFDELEEPLRAIIRRLTIRENAFEDMSQTAKGCILSLQKKRLERESVALQNKIRDANRNGNHLLVESLQRRHVDLRRALNQMSLS
ncbi:MAG: DNA primase [Candidatus Manganitrophaceae bacterium]